METDNGSPAQADTVPANGGGSQEITQPSTTTTTTPTGSEDTPSAFSVPEAYKEKSWAGKLKSQDDVWKQLDNLDQMVGKKTIAPIDYSKATPEEIAEYHSKTRPADKSAYQFGEGSDPAFSASVADVFYEAGISDHQAKIILEKIPAVAAELYKAQAEADRSADGYLKMATEAFGEAGKSKISFAETNLKQFASKEDYAVLDGLDNATRIAVDRTILSILDKHGVVETGAQGEGGHGSLSADKATARSEVRKQIAELEKRPHTAEEKQSLINQLNKFYS